ncbi:MAG TPA: hypothetical protein VFB00_10045, partial [Terriglobales bacterium]|nr:hypothetical protein [Terriglobales bacterium]
PQPIRPREMIAVKTCHMSAVFFAIILISAAWAQSKPAGVLAAADVKAVAPASFFYRGQSAGTQMRNTAGVRTKDEKYILAGMVDTSGYASDVAQKYQGFFITEVKVKVEGTELAPGEYGFGFTGGKFVVTDVGANEVLSVSSHHDDNLKRAVPLKIVEESGSYRLYAGKNYVSVSVE